MSRDGLPVIPPLVGFCSRGHSLERFGAIYICHTTGKPKRVCRECKRENHHLRKAGKSMPRVRQRPRPVCINGHVNTAEDSWVTLPNGKRRCRACLAKAKIEYAWTAPRRVPIIDEGIRTKRILDLQDALERETRAWLRPEIEAQLRAAIDSEPTVGVG